MVTGSAVPASVAADLAAAARDYLRVGDGAEAALLARLAETAVLLAERYCGRVLVARAFEETVDGTGEWRRLSVGPVTAIAGVSVAGMALPVEAWAVDIDAGGDGWVRIAAGAQAVVSYTAGLAASFAALPAPVAQGCVMLVAHLFEHRDGAVLPPAAVAALWRPYRRMTLGVTR